MLRLLVAVAEQHECVAALGFAPIDSEKLDQWPDRPDLQCLGTGLMSTPHDASNLARRNCLTMLPVVQRVNRIADECRQSPIGVDTECPLQGVYDFCARERGGALCSSG